MSTGNPFIDGIIQQGRDEETKRPFIIALETAINDALTGAWADIDPETGDITVAMNDDTEFVVKVQVQR